MRPQAASLDAAQGDPARSRDPAAPGLKTRPTCAETMTLFRDIEYAWRTLVANKGFTAVAVICLALGIGVNTTAFSITDGVLIQPLPYQDAGRLVVLNQSNTRTGVRFGGISYLDLQDWRQQTSAFSAIGAFQGR